MSDRGKFWWLLVAVVIGLTPAIDITWHLVQNLMPGPWWWSTRIFGWPGFSVLQQLFGDSRWVPMNVADMSLSRHLSRWVVFLLVNTGLWILVALGLERLLRTARSG